MDVFCKETNVGQVLEQQMEMTVRSNFVNKIQFLLYEVICIHKHVSDVANIQKCGLIEQDGNLKLW